MKRASGKAKYWNFIALGFLALIIILCRNQLWESYFHYRVYSAETAEQERAAFLSLNKWNHSYSVEVFDQKGQRTHPHVSGRWESSYFLRILLKGGTIIERKILHPESIKVLFRE